MVRGKEDKSQEDSTFSVDINEDLEVMNDEEEEKERLKAQIRQQRKQKIEEQRKQLAEQKGKNGEKKVSKGLRKMKTLVKGLGGMKLANVE